MSILYGLLTYCFAQTFIVIQQNITKVYPDISPKQFHLLLMLSSLPVTYLYYYAWNVFVNQTGSMWSARFIFFGLSYLVFPFLAYYILNENMFTLKNLICIALSILIIVIQYKF